MSVLTFFFFSVTERSFLRRHHRWRLVNGTESFKKLVLEPEIDISILNFSIIWVELFLKIQLIYQQVPVELQQTKTRLSNVENIKKISVSILVLKQPMRVLLADSLTLLSLVQTNCIRDGEDCKFGGISISLLIMKILKIQFQARLIIHVFLVFRGDERFSEYV